MPARVRVEALHAIDAGRVSKGRVYRAACVYGRFKVRLGGLVVRSGTIRTARVTSSTMGGGIVSGRGLVVGRIGGVSTLGDGDGLGSSYLTVVDWCIVGGYVMGEVRDRRSDERKDRD